MMQFTLACAVLAPMLVGLVAAQPAPSAVRCDAVLTQDEARVVVGDGYAGPAVSEPRPGFTGCEWQGSDSNFGFTFTSLRTLADDSKTAEQEFEFTVSAVENDERKRELIPGLAARTAVVSLGDEAFLVAVQRPDGVARMITYKIDREKMLALAKAIAAP
jgi:hypothetical protein